MHKLFHTTTHQAPENLEFPQENGGGGEGRRGAETTSRSGNVLQFPQFPLCELCVPMLKVCVQSGEPGDSVKITSLRDETIVNYNIVLAQPET